MEREIRRRRVLGGLGTLAAGGTLAGCSTDTRRDGTDTGDGAPDGTGDDGADDGSDGGGTEDGASGTEDGADGTEGSGGGTDDGGSSEISWPSYLDDANEDTFEDHTGEDEVAVAVENFYFDPTKLLVDSGTTVVWEFNAPAHNVKPQSQPGDDLEGTPGGEFDPVSQGETYSETLETSGTYTYFCGPHEDQGMIGGIQVD